MVESTPRKNQLEHVKRDLRRWFLGRSAFQQPDAIDRVLRGYGLLEKWLWRYVETAGWPNPKPVLGFRRQKETSWSASKEAEEKGMVPIGFWGEAPPSWKLLSVLRNARLNFESLEKQFLLRESEGMRGAQDWEIIFKVNPTGKKRESSSSNVPRKLTLDRELITFHTSRGQHFLGRLAILIVDIPYL